MSPTLMARLRRIDFETRLLANGPDPMGAIYPRDYYRPYEQLKRSRGIQLRWRY